jgi:probable addiction module antidote protein
MNYKTDLLVDLKSLDYCAKYLRAAIADSPEAFLVALRDVAEAQQGMTKLASAAGVNRENLYRMLSGRGNPRLENLKAVLDAIGLQIEFVPAKKSPPVANSRRH